MANHKAVPFLWMSQSRGNEISSNQVNKTCLEFTMHWSPRCCRAAPSGCALLFRGFQSAACVPGKLSSISHWANINRFIICCLFRPNWVLIQRWRLRHRTEAAPLVNFIKAADGGIMDGGCVRMDILRRKRSSGQAGCSVMFIPSPPQLRLWSFNFSQ